jgi:uncharacterized protein Yka (UPF0111/DUF47 family)
MGPFGKKNRVNFFDMLKNQASLTVDGVQALCVYCDAPTDENAAAVKEFEVSADNARRLLISEINKTFITPIEREDLFDLSCAIDDIVDYAATAIEELRIYKLTPDDHIKKMSNTILKLATGILKAVSHLEHNRDISSDEAIKVKKLENVINGLYHAALSELFEIDDIKKILKSRELYRHLNNAADKGDHAADVLLNIIVKM